jgi:hypothetical protein
MRGHMAAELLFDHSCDEFYAPLYRWRHARLFQVLLQRNNISKKGFNPVVIIFLRRHPHAFPLLLPPFEIATFCRNSHLIDTAMYVLPSSFTAPSPFSSSALSFFFLLQQRSKFNPVLRRARSIRCLDQATDCFNVANAWHRDQHQLPSPYAFR